MKKLSILILTLTIFFLIVPAVQATDYAALKNNYITAHPGQAIIPFPWETTTSIKVLPINYEIPAAPGNTFSMTACRNEFESASFIITARKDLSGIQINVPNLYSSQGNSIPADAINVRLVKVWYQADNGDIINRGGRVLTPELLLKDDSLVNVDYVNKINYLKVTINGNQQYIDISSPTATLPSNAQIHDAASLQPFSLKANENKQIWLTVQVPSNTPTGDYYGNIKITAPSEAPVITNISVKVLPFDLEPSPIEYSIYYRGTLPSTDDERQQLGINWQWKSTQQYAAEIQNMKDHGINYPTFANKYAYWNPQDPNLKLELSLRAQSGLPTDHIYVYTFETGFATSQTDLANRVKQLKNVTSQYGYQDVYVYGTDEAKGDVLRSERTAWQTVHNSGARVFAACYNDAVGIVGDLLDVAVLAGPLSTTQAAQWYSNGKRIFNYANPQVGVENPEIYRQNYGFALWNAGYDGAMDFAYQQGFGHIWNDFDDTHYRDHVFAYPTSDGVIDTIQWEGWQEGVDDTRYLASLIKKEGSITSAKTLISGSLSQGDNMTTIRKKVIIQILISPTAQFTANTTQGQAPLTVQFTDQSISMGTTTYKWDMTNDGVVHYTTKNPVHSYQSAGNYTVNLTVSDASWSDSESKTDYITVKPAPVTNFTHIGIFRNSNSIWYLVSIMTE